jgi:hypothetical protein
MMADFKPRPAEELARRDKRGEALPTSKVNTLKQTKSRTIAQMGFEERDLRQVPRAVQDLTVSDLEDFAKKMAGVGTTNPAIERLTIEDIQGIEYLFAEEKNLVLARVASQLTNVGSLAASDVDVSCCCCTPCCCCAAADVDPLRA